MAPGRGRSDRRDDRSDDEDKASNDGTGLQTQLKKTKLCKHFQNGQCQFGSNCTFAHNEAELVNAPNLAKTRLCKAFEGGDVPTRIVHSHMVNRNSDRPTLFSRGACASGTRRANAAVETSAALHTALKICEATLTSGRRLEAAATGVANAVGAGAMTATKSRGIREIL